MRFLSAVEVLSILAERMEKRAAVLDRLQMSAFDPAASELRKFALMIRKAQAYVASQRR